MFLCVCENDESSKLKLFMKIRQCRGNFSHRSFLSSPLGLVIKTEKEKASHLGVAQKIGCVGTEVLSFSSDFSELFLF